jgi:hypothetical protein
MSPGTLVELPDGRRGYFQSSVSGTARVLVEVLLPVKDIKQVKK